MEILDRISEIIKHRKTFTMFELGTNDAYHTVLINDIIRSHGIPYKYIAFEPDRRLHATIQKKISKYPEITLCVSACGAVEGEVEFHLSGGVESRPSFPKQHFTGSSSIRKPKLVTQAWPDMKFTTTKVSCTTIDSVCERHNIKELDFIWMDVQGAEIDVFAGARKMLRNIRYIYTEVCESELYEGEIGLKEIQKMLPGFEIVENYVGDVLFRNKRMQA